MNPRTRYVLSCVAVGTLVVILVALLGFWSRWICTDILNGLTRGRSRGTRVSPVGVLPEEIEQAPDVVVHSEVTFGPEEHRVQPWVAGLGAVDYFYGLSPESGRSDILAWVPEDIWLYYDRKLGLIVYSKVVKPSANSGRPRRAERMWLYAGPEGMAESPDETLGRFQSPVSAPHGQYLHLYDAQHRRFFALDFQQRKVAKGPELNPAEGHEPVQIVSISKRRDMLSWRIEPPRRKRDPNGPDVPPEMGRALRQAYPSYDLAPTIQLAGHLYASPYLFVLDASGRIDLLDKETLEFAGRAAVLPTVDEFFGRPRRPAQPRSLFAYAVQPLLMPADDSPSKWQYLGCVAGAYNRDGTCMTLATFNKQGSQVGGSTRWTIEYEDVPGGPMVATARFLLENLHPPALLLLSYFTAPYGEAGAGYRSIFVLPNSLVAKQGRNFRQLYALRLIGALALMVPAIVLAVFLAVLVSRNAQTLGFSKDARTLWILITIAFGLPAYITYRLTRPGATLVTCANCGLPRRPDMDRCHRCNSPWEVPELNPPAWRVLDGGRSDFEEPPMPAEEPAAQ